MTCNVVKHSIAETKWLPTWFSWCPSLLCRTKKRTSLSSFLMAAGEHKDFPWPSDHHRLMPQTQNSPSHIVLEQHRNDYHHHEGTISKQSAPHPPAIRYSTGGKWIKQLFQCQWYLTKKADRVEDCSTPRVSSIPCARWQYQGRRKATALCFFQPKCSLPHNSKS